jgi:Ras GTPase-activating-like protein IQGAP2/3
MVVKLSEIDTLLQIAMFTLYGNQYDDEEEHLLLSVFQVRIIIVVKESQHVLSEEFKQANSQLGNLLRANTALTRMMTTYTR